ncbi:MAG: DUF4058 family protein [Gemmataceae bacterium]
MASPFPGMDPFLENDKLWSSFQHHLVSCLYQTVLPGLVDRYRARVGQRRYATEQALFTSVVRENHEEEYIEIRQRGDGRLITLIEVVSPSNKTTPEGRQAYLAKRDEVRAVRSNIVEIDLVLQGHPMLEYTRDDLPEWDYAVTVTRATQPERHEIYTSTLQKRLPRFRLPLASDDRDTVLDLQATFSRCYDQGDFGESIDYQSEPVTKIDNTDLEWIRNFLEDQNVT